MLNIKTKFNHLAAHTESLHSADYINYEIQWYFKY